MEGNKACLTSKEARALSFQTAVEKRTKNKWSHALAHSPMPWMTVWLVSSSRAKLKEGSSCVCVRVKVRKRAECEGLDQVFKIHIDGKECKLPCLLDTAIVELPFLPGRKAYNSCVHRSRAEDDCPSHKKETQSYHITDLCQLISHLLRVSFGLWLNNNTLSCATMCDHR